MKGLIVYSSLSGNTKKIIGATAEVVKDSKLTSVREFQSSMLANFDLFCTGHWAGKGDYGAATSCPLAQLKNKRTALFGTLEAAEQTEYYDRVKQQVESRTAHCHIPGHFLCQGAVGGVVTVRYQNMLTEYPQDEHIKQQSANYENGKSHSDEQDLADTRAFAKSIG